MGKYWDICRALKCNNRNNSHPPKPQNLARYDREQMESMANNQGAPRPANETQHTMATEDTMTSTEQWYLSPDNNNESVFFRMTT